MLYAGHEIIEDGFVMVPGSQCREIIDTIAQVCVASAFPWFGSRKQLPQLRVAS